MRFLETARFWFWVRRLDVCAHRQFNKDSVVYSYRLTHGAFSVLRKHIHTTKAALVAQRHPCHILCDDFVSTAWTHSMNRFCLNTFKPDSLYGHVLWSDSMEQLSAIILNAIFQSTFAYIIVKSCFCGRDETRTCWGFISTYNVIR